MDNRREHPRYRVLVDLKAHIGKKEYMGAAFNLARNGIRFVASTPIKEHETVVVEFIGVRGLKFIQGGVVVWSKTTKHKDIFTCGVKFNTELGEKQFDDILRRIGVSELDKEK